MDLWYHNVTQKPAHWWRRAGPFRKIRALEVWSCGMYEGVNGQPDIWNSLEYTPQKHFMDKEANNHVFDEMWTGDWWWNTQVNLSTHNLEHELMEILLKKSLLIGLTIAPLLSYHLTRLNSLNSKAIRVPGLYTWQLVTSQNPCAENQWLMLLCSLDIFLWQNSITSQMKYAQFSDIDFFTIVCNV